jgi:hypothetical protein
LNIQLQWHADREQIRAALDTADGSDLVQVATDLKRKCSVLEAENAHLRALVTTARYLASEALHGTMAPAPGAAPAVEAALGGPQARSAGALGALLACPDCRRHFGSDMFVVDACASVAFDTSRSVGRVLADYLALHHERLHGRRLEASGR